MRKIIILAAAAAAVFATPAFAQSGADDMGEARVELRGGVAWQNSDSEAFAGFALGYDFDLGDAAFVGVEVAGDKVLVDGSEVFFTGAVRAGGRVGKGTRLYVLGGYGFTSSTDGPFAGAGIQQKIGSNVYGKVEYRRTLVSGQDINFAGAGLGVAF